MAQRSRKIGDGKSEMGTQAMKMPIPPCLIWRWPGRLLPSRTKTLAHLMERGEKLQHQG